MDYKKMAEQVLDKEKAIFFELGDTLFELPELGFCETDTNRVITNYLDSQGISYEKDIFLTGVKASIGNGGYNIGLVTDLDAISVSDNGKVIAFHSCGHSSQNVIMLAAISTLKKLGIVDKHDCKVTFLGTPAEEYIDLDYRNQLIKGGSIEYYSGKQNMIKAGYFDDVDCILCSHVMGDTTKKFDYGSVLSGFFTKKATFKGVAAHSGASPFLGKNALHGANLFIQAVAFLNEQFPYEAGVQVHPIITNGGIAMNVIPDTVVVESYLRANTKDHLFTLEEKFDNAAKACAQAIGLECEIGSTVGYMPLRQSDVINDVVYKNLLNICDKEDILTGTVSGASGDVGDLSFLMPTVQLGYSGYEGRIHSNKFEITDKQFTYIETAKAIVWSVIDIIENKELQVKNKNYSEDKQYYIDNWLSMK